MADPEIPKRSPQRAVQSLALTLSILPLILVGVQRASTWRGGVLLEPAEQKYATSPYEYRGRAEHLPPAANFGARPTLCGLNGSAAASDRLEICSPPAPVGPIFASSDEEALIPAPEAEEEAAHPPAQVRYPDAPRAAEPPRQQPPEDQRRYAPSPAPAPYWMRHAKAEDGAGLVRQRTRKYTVPARAI